MQEEEDDFLGEEEEEPEESDVGETAEMKQELTDAEKAGYTLLKEDDDDEDLKEDEDEETEDGKVILRCPSAPSNSLLFSFRR